VLLEKRSFEIDAGRALTYVDSRRVGARVAQPHVEALIVGGKRLGAGDPVGDPAHRGVQDAVHEEDAVPSICAQKLFSICTQ